MRIRQGRQEGSVLIVVVVVMALAGITLGSYLQLVANQNLSVVRSMAWNGAISVAEAGIEEAMAHVNRNGTNRASDGWEDKGTVIHTPMLGTNLTVAANYVVRDRTMGSSKYTVYVTRDIDPPIVYAEGYVVNPQNGQFLPLPRIIRATTETDFLFTKGMVAKGQIDLSGNNIKTDSFDSSNDAYSTDGKYDSAKAKDGGDVATNSSMIDSLNVWNADIFGKVSTGPGGTVKIGQNGAIGSKAWHDAGNTGIEEGYATDDMNVYFPEVQAPFMGGGWAPAPSYTWTNGTTYAYALSDGEYQMNSLSMSSSSSMLVKGHAVLYVLGNVSLSGQSSIFIAPGASLQMYVAGPTTSIGGQGVLNSDAKASSFGYWGLPSNKQISMSGNAAFTGTIYAPQAALTLGGGGNNNYDFVGSTITDTVKMNGHFQFHYDEALKSFGPRRGYSIASWNEASWEEVHGMVEVFGNL